MANAAVFEVKEYMVILRQLEEMDHKGHRILLKGIVRCLGDEYTLDIYCCAPDSDFPEPDIDIDPDADPDEEPDKYRGYMFVPFADLPVFVDLLRNEKPIYAHLRGDKPEWTSITTTKEPVGEGEDAMIGASR
ncbi:MAG: hypothetical protein AAF125_11035 [Chloroflexota bacterium]